MPKYASLPIKLEASQRHYCTRRKMRRGTDNSMPPVKQKISKNQLSLLYQKYVKAVYFSNFSDFTAWGKEKKYNTSKLLNS